MNIQEKKFQAWRQGLLDVSRRNKLMNYRKSRRATLQILVPGMEALYRRLAVDGQKLAFRRRKLTAEDDRLTRILDLFADLGTPIEIAEGEVRSDMETDDMNLTLKNLRSKARLSQEEQGINILYLSFGFLRWRQKPSEDWLISPLILVPVTLEMKSLTSPYTIRRLEEDIVVNPTLEYVLSADFHMTLPEFDPASEEIDSYLQAVQDSVESLGWSVIREANLGLLSFLKIVMYKDLEKNREKIFSNRVIRAFCGDPSQLPVIEEEWENYDHDQDPESDQCQVVAADASQKDAILLSRRGVSFVLQGPPGTGKSQTITNIIAQAMADGKRVLFVSQKMAALSVVYRRLEEAGIADYCLSLHNYKAEKKAVLQDLARTLDAPKRTLKSGYTHVFDSLEEERNRLNLYDREMNLVRMPLGRTLFDVVTDLSGMEDVPLCTLEDDTLDVSGEEYEIRRQLLEKYARVAEQYKEELADHPWRGTSLTEQDPMTAQILFGRAPLPGLCADIQRVQEQADAFNQKLALHKDWSFQSLEELIACELLRRACTAAREYGRARYGSGLFCPEGYTKTKESYNSLRNHLQAVCLYSDTVKWENADTESLQRERKETAAFADELEKCSRFMEEAGRLLGSHLTVSDSSLQQVRAAYDMLRVPADYKVRWFTGPLSIEELTDRIHKIKDLADAALAQKKLIDAEWEQSFYALDEEALLGRFQTEYTSFFKKLGKGYKDDKKRLTSCRRDRRKCRDEDGIRGLERLREFHADVVECQVEIQKLPAQYGMREEDVFTDWAGILQSLALCMPVENYAAAYPVQERLTGLCEQPYGQRLRFSYDGKTVTEEEIKDWLRRLQAVLAKLDGDEAGAALTAAREQLEDLDAASIDLEHIRELFQTAGIASDSARITDSLEVVKAFNRLYENVEKADTAAASYFAETGLDMHDPAVIEELDVLCRSLAPQGLSADTASPEEALAAAMEAEHVLQEAIPYMPVFAAWFPQKDFAGMSLQDFYTCADRCRDTEALSSWLHYADIERQCQAHSLMPFLEYAGQNELDLEGMQLVYRKAFLSKWVMDSIQAGGLYELLRFSAEAHEQTIEAFQKDSDTVQSVVRARLSSQLSGQKPSGFRQLVGALDEISILRREAGKKSRIMPLRRLFKTIPGLLGKLKPCFMMSPLSAAYFLDSDRYDFDMVIFDEASQILPEDAVGAIYRGRQAIIAGDTRQLPPTSFFTAAAKNIEELDWDEDSDEYYPDVVSESLLDEAGVSLPQCTLLWHYRSKDESLIAFSNKELYENRLITFPNSRLSPDKGLEYIYVEDGVYEGGGKNHNVREAEVCVSLLQEHLKTHPDRSLGIVAFSEKQQAEIENAVNRFRLQNLEYESFFDENQEEPFFVKNLENVQGDERDTIIFSICYAKNSQGRMYQRFGPLGAAGGERRLNVAITRAKYNIKLVGSIQPTDIVVKEGTSAGVRMLRDYMQYAIENSYHVPEGSDQVWTGEAFADEVADYITGLGYSLRREIGQSACKVDIGIVNPQNDMEYLAGIECDGSHYHFARTAYDRDVRRRSVMTSMGWKLHHVWAMSWYLKPEEEKKRLKDFLDRVTAGIEAEETSAELNMQAEETGIDDLTMQIDNSSEITTLRFDEYQEADPLTLEMAEGSSDEAYWLAQVQYILEVEQPVHKKEVYRRMCPALDAAKVTAVVKHITDQCLDHLIEEEIAEERGEFLYLKGAEKISPRRPAEGTEAREIDLIAQEEIQAGFLAILKYSLGLTREELLRECTRQFGYAQSGPRIKIRLEEVLDDMLARADVKESDGRLYLTEEEA